MRKEGGVSVCFVERHFYREIAWARILPPTLSSSVTLIRCPTSQCFSFQHVTDGDVVVLTRLLRGLNRLLY